MKGLILIGFFLNSVVVFCQNPVTIKIIDDVTSSPIDHVKVQLKSNQAVFKQFTDENGLVKFNVQTTDSVQIECVHPNFVTRSLRFSLKDSTLKLIVLSKQKITYLDGVVVKPTGVPDTIVQSEKFSVHDYAVLNDGRYILLTYSKNPKKGCSLQLVDGNKTVHELDVFVKYQDLIRDYKGDIHAVSEKEVVFLSITGNSIELIPYNKEYYQSHIQPLIDSTKETYYFSNYKSFVPEMDYFSYVEEQKIPSKIRHIIDKETMVQYRSEYKWVDVRTRLWARDKERETGIDAEMWVGANYYTQSIYYKPIYAPLFVQNDTIYIFDHYSNWLFKHDYDGRKLDSIPIYHHLDNKKTGWKQQIIQDNLSKELFFLYEKDGNTYLKNYNPTTGNLSKSVQLHFKYIENIQINGNQVYYIYRPYESIQKKFIYREKLPAFAKSDYGL